MLRNYYSIGIFAITARKSKVDEWAQGFILKFSSGYTPGPVGFGLEGIAMLGVKLDSSRVRVRAIAGEQQAAADNFVALAAKARFSATELKSASCC